MLHMDPEKTKMSNDQLQREYGILLGTCGPILLDRIDKFRRLAEVVGPGMAADWLGAQAERAEQTIKAIGRKFDERQR